jgi:MFS family permease
MAVHQTRLLVDMGYSLQLAAMLFGLTGLFRSVGGFIWGPLSDRYGSRIIVLLGGAMGSLGVGALLMVHDATSLTTLVVFVVLFGIGFGGISPVYASIVSQLFPGRSLGKIFGLLDVGYGAGSAGGPFLAGWVYDRFASYDIALYALVVAAGGSGLFLFLAIQSHRWYLAANGLAQPAAEDGAA